MNRRTSNIRPTVSLHRKKHSIYGNVTTTSIFGLWALQQTHADRPIYTRLQYDMTGDDDSEISTLIPQRSLLLNMYYMFCPLSSGKQ